MFVKVTAISLISNCIQSSILILFFCLEISFIYQDKKNKSMGNKKSSGYKDEKTWKNDNAAAQDFEVHNYYFKFEKQN